MAHKKPTWQVLPAFFSGKMTYLSSHCISLCSFLLLKLPPRSPVPPASPPVPCSVWGLVMRCRVVVLQIRCVWIPATHQHHKSPFCNLPFWALPSCPCSAFLCLRMQMFFFLGKTLTTISECFLFTYRLVQVWNALGGCFCNEPLLWALRWPMYWMQLGSVDCVSKVTLSNAQGFLLVGVGILSDWLGKT